MTTRPATAAHTPTPVTANPAGAAAGGALDARGCAAQVSCVLVLVAVPVVWYSALYGSGDYWPVLAAAVAAGVAGAGGAVTAAALLRRATARSWPGRVVSAAVLAGVAALVWLPARPRAGLPGGATWDDDPGAPAGGPADAALNALRAILTLNQPVDVTRDVLVLPFAVTAAATGLALLGLRSRAPLAPLLPPTVALAVQVLLCAGAGRPAQVAPGVAAFAAAAVLLLGLRRRHAAEPQAEHQGEHQGERQPERQPERRAEQQDGGRRGIAGLAGFAVAAAAVGAGSVMAGGAPDRFDPRERWQPAATDLHVTPLALVKSELSGPDDPRFSIRMVGGHDVQRVAVARLDVFDGTAWTARPRFRTAGTALRADDVPVPAAARTRADVQVTALPGDLLPAIGSPVRLERQDAGAVPGSVLLDRPSGMLLARTAPTSWRYTVDGVGADDPLVEGAPADGALADGGAADGETAPSTATCRPNLGDPAVAALRAAWLPGSLPTRAALDELARRMRAELPYSPDAPAGSSLGAIERVLSGTAPGDGGYAEQHAAAFSYLACLADRPARVVVGYRLPAPAPSGQAALVRAHRAHAWSQVWFAGSGWVSFDPTDPDKQVTRFPAAGSGTLSDVPPPVSSAPAPAPGTTGPRPPPLDPQGGWNHRLTTMLRDLGISALIGLIVVLTGLLVAVLARRAWARWLRLRARARRREQLLRGRRSHLPAERVLAAWAAVTDLCRDRGLPVRASSTPDEVAAMADGVVPAPRDAVPQLVELVNATLFGPLPPSADDADEAWTLSDDVHAAQARPAPPSAPEPVGGGRR